MRRVTFRRIIVLAATFSLLGGACEAVPNEEGAEDSAAEDATPVPPPTPDNDGFGLDREAMSACKPIEPRELPDGSAPGEPEDLGYDGQHVSWGKGDAEVRQATGLAALELLGDRQLAQAEYSLQHASQLVPEYVVDVDGNPRVLTPLDEPPTEGEMTITLSHDGCTYVNWVDPGVELEEARDYAKRF